MILTKYFSLLVFLVPLALSAPEASARDFAPPKPDDRNFVLNADAASQAGRVFGYVTSQTAALDEIARKYPHLARDAVARKTAFDTTYGFPWLRAKWFLTHALGQEKTAAIEDELEAQAQEAVRSISEADALAFFSEMDARLSGQLSPSVLKTMLWLRFADSPAREMRDWKTDFSSAGHAKALGLDMELHVPRSWRQGEGDRPHVLSKWTSQNGSGDMVITLLVRKLPGQFTFADVQEVEQTADWGWITPAGFQFLDGKAIEMDRQPGLEIDMMGDRRALDLVLTHRVRLYTLFPSDRMVQLNCILASPSGVDPDWYDARFHDLQEVCRSVALTLTLPDTWQ